MTHTPLTLGLLALLLSACGGSSLRPPPSYSDDCVPSDDHFLRLARSTDNLAAPGEIPDDPQAALDEANRIVRAERYVTLKKSPDEPEQWRRFTTTLKGVILLGADWDEQTTRSKAATMWHELVHTRQWAGLGDDGMTLTYVVEEGRWALEVQAYRETARVLVQWGASDEEMELWLQDRIERLYEGYSIAPMPRQCMARYCEEIWSSEWR